MNQRWTDPALPGMVNSITIDNYFTTIIPSGANGLSSFKSGTTYAVTLYYYSNVPYYYDTPQAGTETIPGLEANGQNYFSIANTTITTPTADAPVQGTIDPTGKTVVPGSPAGANGGLPVCYYVENSNWHELCLCLR